jgi:hypothetical protein
MCAPLLDSHPLVIHTDQGAITMKQAQERPLTTSPNSRGSGPGNARTVAPLALWQLNVLRVGYLFMGGGLALIKWPLIVSHDPWSVVEGTKECLFIAMSFLALLGLRYPARMLPILLFEVTWKVIWLALVALPAWTGDGLHGATLTLFHAVALVVVIIAVIPWRHVFAQFVAAPADPWRRQK